MGHAGSGEVIPIGSFPSRRRGLGLLTEEAIPGGGGRQIQADPGEGEKGLRATTPDAPGVVWFHKVSPASYRFKPLRKASKCFEIA